MNSDNRKILKCLIIDPDVNALRETSRMIDNHPQLEIINSCKTGRSAYFTLNDSEIDLVFMNPALPDTNGFDLIKAMDNPPLVVILSDRPDYAFYAYRIDAVDYRMKPLIADRLEVTLDRVYMRLAMREAFQKSNG